MIDLIQKLKDNRYPFGMWPDPECYGKELGEAMQAKAEEIGITNNFRKFCGAGWGGIFKATGIKFHREDTYRLREDYEEKPEIVECEVYLIQGELHCKKDEEVWILNQCCSSPDFIGFKYEDGCRRVSPIYFQMPTYANDQIHPDKTSDFKAHKVLHATHVLFRSKK